MPFRPHHSLLPLHCIPGLETCSHLSENINNLVLALSSMSYQGTSSSSVQRCCLMSKLTPCRPLTRADHLWVPGVLERPQKFPRRYKVGKEPDSSVCALQPLGLLGVGSLCPLDLRQPIALINGFCAFHSFHWRSRTS